MDSASCHNVIDWSDYTILNGSHCNDDYVPSPSLRITANTSLGKPELFWNQIIIEDDYIEDFDENDDDFVEDFISNDEDFIEDDKNFEEDFIENDENFEEDFNNFIHLTKYRIYRSDRKIGPFKYLGTSTSNSYMDISALAGNNYYYKIRALDTDTDTYSNYSNIVNRVCDLAMPSVSISVNTTTGKPVVKWETVEGAAKYYVYRSDKKSSGYEKVYTAVKARSYTDTDSVAGTNYYYKVKAIHENSSANSAYSTIVNRVCDLAKPSMSITLTAGGNPWIKWEAVEDADGYQVYRATSKSGTYKLVKTTVSATSFADRDAKSETKYYYKIRAIHSNTNANSAYSSVKSITAK